MKPEDVEVAVAVYMKASAMISRFQEEITALYSWQLLEPGVYEVSRWQPELEAIDIGGNCAPVFERSGAMLLGGVAKR